ncbi:SixA phosphatase family protein [Actinomyces sp. MRS3W]|uniref:SixA phosphatase family protein n=1 Tax=Actinomyces sp. MRS3W TaxID=2800796 RepID=UPI0028FD0995|nr:histidine phosphatase family protein [Actinomyces sp. MRS3W]MDU0349492.1 histidine phosphatase family protein [Actinomyces sp. MRS3W]
MTTDSSGKILVLVRHSKAAHNAPTDLERPLTSRGRALADELARALGRRMSHLDLLLVSPAVRARQTARPMTERLAPALTRVEPEIYHEGPGGILRLLEPLPETTRQVLVVGHEPTVSVLAHLLHDTADDLADQVSFGIPTATALVLQVPGAWAGLGPHAAHLSEIVTARR